LIGGMRGKLESTLIAFASAMTVLNAASCAKTIDLSDTNLDQLASELCPVVQRDYLQCEVDLTEAEKDLEETTGELTECLLKQAQ